MYTPGFAAPEMYRRDVPLGPWTDVYAIGASLYACMQGGPPPEATQRQTADRLPPSLARLRGAYSDRLIEVVKWCMALDAMARPQSVFALQRALSREPGPTHTAPTLVQRLRAQLACTLSGRRAA
jgi:serine/threonine protein kinase